MSQNKEIFDSAKREVNIQVVRYKGAKEISKMVESGQYIEAFVHAQLLGNVIDSLKPGGRAGIILPEGTLFGTNRDDKEIRRYLLENCSLEAVVSMPGGVFEPYSGVKTSVLIFSKGRPTEEVWFYDLKGDGSSLSKVHKFGPQYRNDIPDLLAKWPNREMSEQSWKMSVKEIVGNDYILSANAYNPNIGGEEKEHREPKEILREIEKTEKEAEQVLKRVRSILK